MKQVIGIYCGDMNFEPWDDVSVRTKGAGGSETWVVEIASEFQRRGFHVIVFGQPSYWHFADDGVEYVPWDSFDNRCQYQHFDYFISWRRLDIVTPYLNCQNVYGIAEDMDIYCGDGDTKPNKVKKIAYLSEFAKLCLKYKHPELDDAHLMKAFNPVPSNIYEDVANYTKKNQMVWSSTKYRGLPYFIDNIFPKIREAVPDFELVVCSYLGLEDDYLKKDGIRVIGCVGKEELSKLQKESKVWIYPNEGRYYDGKGLYFQETFCNTAVENGLAENGILCFNIGGLSTTLEGYEGIIGNEWGDKYDGQLYIWDDNDLRKATNEMIEKSIKLLTDEDYRIHMAKEAKNICMRYSPYEAVNTWLNEWGIRY